MTSKRRGSILVLASVVAFGLYVAPAQAAYDGPRDVPEPTTVQLAKSVTIWDPSRSVRSWSSDDAVNSVEQVETKAGETTISLSTDILFTPDSSKLPGSAADKIGSLVEKIPKGAKVLVYGHTDSVTGKVDNKELSKDRAEAVAAVLNDERSDLSLSVKGMAATEPAVREDPSDPSSFAANRRVEITYSQ